MRRRAVGGVRLEGDLQVEDVVDHILDDLQLAELLVARHVGHQLLEFGEQRVHFFLIQVALLAAIAANAAFGHLGEAPADRLLLLVLRLHGHLIRWVTLTAAMDR